MPYFEAIDRTKLFYSAWGTGHPILFIHGGNIGSEIWTFQLPFLTENGYQCIVYDQRGFARSDCPNIGYDFDTLASDLNQLIEHLDLHRLSIVTFSFGAGVLARYLSLFGAERVNHATLIAPITPFFLRTSDNPEGLDRETAYEPFRTGMLRDRPQIIRDSLDAFFGPGNSFSEGIREWTLNLALQSPLMPMLELFRASSETDFRDNVKAFTMQTLIIHGDADVFVPAPSTGVRTHRLIPGSKFLLYEGASHGLLFTHYHRPNNDIAQALGSLSES